MNLKVVNALYFDFCIDDKCWRRLVVTPLYVMVGSGYCNTILSNGRKSGLFYNYEKIWVAYGHPLSRTCGGLEEPFRPYWAPLAPS